MAIAISESLRALWEERAQLRIQISLMTEQDFRSRGALLAAKERLVALDHSIKTQKTNDNGAIAPRPARKETCGSE